MLGTKPRVALRRSTVARASAEPLTNTWLGSTPPFVLAPPNAPASRCRPSSSIRAPRRKSSTGYTLEEFGEAKYLEYRDLIGLALKTLATTPRAGKHRSEIHPDAWTYHIARPGRKARHLFLYRIRDVVEVARFLYDAMDLPRQRPKEWK